MPSSSATLHSPAVMPASKLKHAPDANKKYASNLGFHFGNLARPIGKAAGGVAQFGVIAATVDIVAVPVVIVGALLGGLCALTHSIVRTPFAITKHFDATKNFGEKSTRALDIAMGALAMPAQMAINMGLAIRGKETARIQQGRENFANTGQKTTAALQIGLYHAL